MFKFGSEEIRQIFRQTNDKTMLNHGSYGLTPQLVMDKRFELLREQEEHPDVWFRIKLIKYYTEAIMTAAKFLNADIEDLFVTDNATTGINSVLKSLKFESGSKILLTSHTYLAVKNTSKDIEEIFGGFQRVFLDFPVPIGNEDEIVSLYEKFFSENPDIKLTVIDHITSVSAIVLPVKKLVALCRRYNVLCFIDGAHAPGQIQLNMKDIGADFYVGNFYKWMYTARSCAFLWVSPNFRNKILPPLSSNGTQTMHHRFAFMGARDYSAMYTLPTALKFFGDVGGLNAITSYTNELLTWAQSMICEALETKPLGIPDSMRAPSMAIVGIPSLPKAAESLTSDELTVQFWLKYSVQVKFSSFNGKMWLRISANIYNCKKGYMKLRDALMDFFEISQMKQCPVKGDATN